MRNQKSNHMFSWWWLAIVAIATVSLGTFGFFEYAQNQSGIELNWLDAFYRSLQLFTLDSGAQIGKIPLTLEIARWLALLVTFSAAIKGVFSLVTNQTKSLYQLSGIKEHVIVCGIGRQGFYIAKQLLMQNIHKVVVIEYNASNLYLVQLKHLGAIILLADASLSDSLLKAKINSARYLISTTEDDITNIKIIRQAKTLKTNKLHLDCYAHIRDHSTKALFYNHPLFSDSKSRFNARLFNIFDQGARLLFDQYAPDLFRPIIDKNDPAASLLIFGFTPLVTSLILHAARTGYYANSKKISITLVDENAESSLLSLYQSYPELESIIDITPENYSTQSLKPDSITSFLAKQPDIIYICINKDIPAITLANRITKLFKNNRIAIVVSLFQQDSLSYLLGDIEFNGLGVSLFPLFDSTSHVDQVIAGQMDRAAKIIHQMYCENQLALDDTREKNPILIPWDNLPEGIKDANRGQADHLPIKLRAIGLNLEELVNNLKPIVFSEQQIQTLANMEHQRWMAGKKMDGWQSTDGKKDIEKKLTPLLIDFDQLPSEEKRKDEQVVSSHIPKLIHNLRKNLA